MNDFDELIQMSGQYNILTIQRPYITYTGSPEGGLLISQMIYWARRTNDPDGWFYKSYADWEEEICVKRKSVTKFSLRWIEEGFLETKVKKNPHGVPVLHYRFSVQIFKVKYREFLDMSQETDGHSQNRKASRSSKSACPERQMDLSPETKDCSKSNKSTLYTSTTPINSSTNTSPERGREEVFDGEVISGELVSEDEQTRSDFAVQQPKDSSLTQDDRREDQIAAAPKKSEDWNYSAMGPIDVVSVAAVVTTDEPCTTSQYIDVVSNGFEGFRAVYEELCDNVDGRFGSVEVARESWRVAWRGLEPPEDFWAGLNLYCNQQKNEFLRTGKCWTLGAKRFLEDEKWRSALRIGARDQRAAAQGVDFHNPELLKKEALIASNRRNGELARLSLIEKGFLTA